LRLEAPRIPLAQVWRHWLINHHLHLGTLVVGPKHQTATQTTQTQRDRPPNATVSLTLHLSPTAMPDVRSATAALLTAPAISPALVIRPPVQPFKPTSETLPKIWFRHPAYDDRENKLLVLYGFDSRGLHHETARIACCILASCPWEDGYLSLTRDGPGVVLGPDDVLTATSYYFQVRNGLFFPSPDPPSRDAILSPCMMLTVACLLRQTSSTQ